MKNILGDEVAPQTLTFEFKAPHLTIFRGGKFAGMVSPNGWTGGFQWINYNLGEPVLGNCNGSLSLSEMKQIILEWEKNNPKAS